MRYWRRRAARGRLQVLSRLGRARRLALFALAAVIAGAAVAVLVAGAAGLALAAWITLALAVLVMAALLPDVGRRVRAIRRRGAHQLLLAEYARLAAGRGRDALIGTMQRTRSVPAREILVFLASDGRRTMHDVLASLETYRDPALRRRSMRDLSVLELGWAAELARLLVVQSDSPADIVNGATLYTVLRDREGLRALARGHQRYFVEALLAAGRRDEAVEIASTWTDPTGDDLRLIADTINPFLGDRGSDEGAWLATVAGIFDGAGLEPIGLLPSGASAFDRLTATTEDVVRGPVVTVVISAFRPEGDGLRTAVRSALASTWRDLEVLVVDDGSGDAYDEVFAGVGELDARVRVLRLTANGGTYRARNHALDAATGDYVTFHDSDDWMHPRRIERQLAVMRDDPAIVATASRSIRVTDDLQFSNHRILSTKICEPSLLFRREQIAERVGYFDSVRKSGDVEFRRRLEAAFGTQVVLVEDAPLTFQRTTGGSLTQGDIAREWVSPARRAYFRTAELWHARIAEGTAPARLEAAPARRPFYAPAELLDPVEGPSRFDVVFLSNWSVMGSQGGSQRSNEEEIRALVAAGMRVGVVHVEAFWFLNRGRWKLSPRLVGLLEEGLVELVQLDSAVTADLLIIRYPPVLQFLSRRPSAIQAGRVLVVANQPPHDRGGSGRRYEVDLCSERVFEVFGRWPTWVPQGPIVRDLLSRLLAPAQLLDADMPALIDPAEWTVTRAPRDGRRPVVGRYSRDHATKWPASRADVMAAYRSDSFDTLIMGGPGTLRRVVGRERSWPASWTVLTAGDIPAREFLGRIDFFVYFHHPDYREAFGRSIVEAMASGAVVILADSFRPVFGDAAVYARPDRVEGIVTALSADAAAYAAQAARGLAFVESVSGHAAYAELIASLRGSP